jgi:hypothetical protein
VSASTKGQQAEHAADHRADALGRRLQPRAAPAAEPVADLVRTELEKKQQQAKRKQTPGGDGDEKAHRCSGRFADPERFTLF